MKIYYLIWILLTPFLPLILIYRVIKGKEKLNRLNDALENYNNLIKLNPDHAEAYRNRGIVLSDLKRLDEAVTSYEKANQINQNLE